MEERFSSMMLGQGSPVWESLTIDLGELNTRGPFDQGGEGVLYQVAGLTGPFSRTLVYKQYRSETLGRLDEEALELFPSFARRLNPDTLAWLYRRAAWPTWIVAEGEPPRRPRGVLMPMARARFMMDMRRTSGGRRTVPAKLELLLNGDEFLESVDLAISMRQRLHLLSALAETVSFFHAHSIVIGDFSCKNVLFSLRPAPSCFVIDCDSMSWDGRSALPPGETPEWELPEGEVRVTKSADVYKFALLVLRMHTGAQHHRSPSHLPEPTFPAVRALVEHTLTCAPSDRPLITEWIAPLRAGAAMAPAEPTATASRPARATRSHPVGLAARSDTASPSNGASPDSRSDLVPAGPAAEFVLGFLRRLLVRQPANPTPLKMVGMLVGLWLACLVVFGVAVLLGVNPRHMTGRGDLILFGSFVLLGLGALALGTTEPR